MTATVLGEITEAREATFREGERGRMVREYRKAFLVRTDDQSDGPLDVVQATGIPARYSALDVDPAARLTDVTPRQRGRNPFVWEVACRYSTQPLKPLDEQTEETGGPADVFDENPDIDFGTDNRRIPANRVWDGDEVVSTGAVLASNGEAINPQPEVEDSLQTLTIVRNQLTFDHAQASSYQKAINSDTFWGFSAGKVRCRRITGRLQWNFGTKFWRVTYSFVIDPEGHAVRPLNQGTYYLESGDPEKKRAFLNKEGQKYIGLLAANGDRSETPSYGSFQGYPSLPFATLMLPGEIP